MKYPHYSVGCHTREDLDKECDAWIDNDGYFDSLADAKAFCKKASKENEYVYTIYKTDRNSKFRKHWINPSKIVETTRRLSSFCRGKVLTGYKKDEPKTYKFIESTDLFGRISYECEEF